MHKTSVELKSTMYKACIKLISTLNKTNIELKFATTTTKNKDSIMMDFTSLESNLVSEDSSTTQVLPTPVVLVWASILKCQSTLRAADKRELYSTVLILPKGYWQYVQIGRVMIRAETLAVARHFKKTEIALICSDWKNWFSQIYIYKVEIRVGDE